ncbi:MAG: hypothetical protein IJI39_05995 [Clostridia bacterium]|nr:hypothetical protein [Clostridia bacterium]
MAITKMKLVTISGLLNQFDTIAEKYIYGRDIHLEEAMSYLDNRGPLTAFEDTGEYETIAKNAANLMEQIGCRKNEAAAVPDDITPEDMNALIAKINRRIEKEKIKQEKYRKELKNNEKLLKRLEKIEGADIDFGKLRELEFIKFKLGHIPKAGYNTLMTYLTDVEAVFVKTSETATDVWGLYFVPASAEQRVAEIFRSLYFEEKRLPDKYSGTPAEIRWQVMARNTELNAKIAALNKKTKEAVGDMTEKLQGVYNLAKKRSQLSEIRRCAAQGRELFYIIGWMSAKDAKKLEREVEKERGGVMLHIEDAENADTAEPPTRLKNNPVFKPFEMFVKMYGLPSYNEIDPTPILAVTYILFFGIMFGDVGQSAVFAILGFILYKVKKIDLAGIIGWVGLSGVVFGFVYGSFFGNEELIPNLLHTTPIRPMEQAIMMLGATIAMGVVIIIFGMILNIINSFKAKNKGEAIFGHNGIAGLLFYLSALTMAGNMFLGWGIPNILFVILIIIAVIAMYMSEPLAKLIEGKKNWWPADGMYFVENLFEMFEVILSFFTNTISFLRIGAFAIVHVGMMMVVSILTPPGGIGMVIVAVIGNAVVMVLEGLIVGIQVLRLEYYEMFSRYFTGRGREFVSLKDK